MHKTVDTLNKEMSVVVIVRWFWISSFTREKIKSCWFQIRFLKENEVEKAVDYEQSLFLRDSRGKQDYRLSHMQRFN